MKTQYIINARHTVKGGQLNDSGIGILVDNHTALHLARSDIPNLLPDLVKEGVKLSQRAGI
jgi:hypothetical protein